mmetsp:Transcript_22827/g.56583  ORF Transcript_22827/g.56583 Transcript_22827/m.56583 type:complete len:219 (-) Transcript_22827:533-1189(-)
MGTSRRTGSMTRERAMRTLTNSGANLFSRTHSTRVLVCPATEISSTSLSARTNCGECGREPVANGKPRKENTNTSSAMTRKLRWYAGPLMSLFSVLLTNSEEMLISTYMSSVSSMAGTTAKAGSHVGPWVRSTSHARPPAGSIRSDTASISSPSTPLPHAVSVLMVMAAAMPKSAVSSRIALMRKGLVRTASAQRPSCRVSSPRRSEKSACDRSYLSS